MKSRIARLWSDHPLIFLTEIGLFLAFGLSLYVMANLETVMSAWAMVPHILCNGIVAVLIIRHRVLGRPAMYWSHLDGVVVLLFMSLLANVYYSEIRAVSWQTAGLYLNCLSAYFLGRMLFYHRVRAYALVMTVAMIVAWLGVYANEHQARGLEQKYHGEAEAIMESMPAGSEEAARRADDLFKRAEYLLAFPKQLERCRQPLRATTSRHHRWRRKRIRKFHEPDWSCPRV